MNVKVIATCFRSGREVREDSKVVFPAHRQNHIKPEQVLEMLKDIVALELIDDAGAPMDVIIVNNDNSFEEGNQYIESINGLKTKNGKIIAYTRPNIGWSFGAFSDAFLKYRQDYMYWVFTEEDIVVTGEHYFKRLIDRWEEIEGVRVPIGYLALVGVIKHTYGIHCGGGIGFTTRNVLNKLVEKFGHLPHHTSEEDPDLSLQGNRQKAILNGEVAFTNEIYKQGFILLDFGPNQSWNTSVNLCVPYYDYKYAK